MTEIGKAGECPHRALNILLVDDNEADVKISTRAFNQASSPNRVCVVGSGQECLDYLRHQGNFLDTARFPRPDIILMDISMPVMDGVTALQEIKNDESLRSIPVVMLTASNNQQDVQRSYMSGASGYLQKPVAYEEFVRFVEGFNFYWQVMNRLPPSG